MAEEFIETLRNADYSLNPYFIPATAYTKFVAIRNRLCKDAVLEVLASSGFKNLKFPHDTKLNGWRTNGACLEYYEGNEKVQSVTAMGYKGDTPLVIDVVPYAMNSVWDKSEKVLDHATKVFGKKPLHLLFFPAELNSMIDEDFAVDYKNTRFISVDWDEKNITENVEEFFEFRKSDFSKYKFKTLSLL